MLACNGASRRRAGQSPEPEAFRISVDVDLVVLQATVRDREGHTVMELGSKDFEVFEDGRAAADPPVPA